MEKSFFLKRIRDSYKNYGDDPWIFLRELAQNSRDSGAGEIRIDLGGFGENKEVIIFSDDGKGMTFKEAKKYLFRLYSSSKSGERYSLGMYGVGFWSVMNFSPDEIIVESYSEEEDRWGISVGPDLEYKRIDCRLREYGTRVTLIRMARYPDFRTFSKNVKSGVLKYCSHLERPEVSGENVQVVFQGEHISDSLKNKSLISLEYGGKDYRGVVSLGDKPKVKLFAGGIPAWEGISIEELSLLNGEAKFESSYIDSGIAPVFTINGRGLKVNIDRKKLIYDKSLKKIIDNSRKALERLVHAYMDYAYPMSLKDRIFRKIKRLFSFFTSSYRRLIFILLLVVIPVEFVILNNVFNRKSGEDKYRAPTMILKTEGYSAYRPTVDRLGENIVADINYSPGENIWFKIFTADRYGRGTGFVKSKKGVNYSENHFPDKTGKPFFITVKVKKGGAVFLPVPDGYTVDPSSVSISGSPVEKGKLITDGDALTVNVKDGGELEYISFPIAFSSGISRGERLWYTGIPRSVILPEKIDGILLKSKNLPVEERVKLCRKLTNILLKYDNSDETVNYFKFTSSNDNWLERVLEIGAGDCDILNGLNALFLRRAGIPSRVVIGFKGEEGKVIPDLHAWTEYYENGWKKTDVSATSEISNSSDPSRNNLNKKRFFRGGRRKSGIGIPEILFLALIMLLLPATLILKKRKKIMSDVALGFEFRNRTYVKQNIAMMVRSYLLNPGIWGWGLNIADIKIITTIQGNQLSLKQIIKLSQAGKLFYGGKENILVRELINSKDHVLDSDDNIFKPVIRIIPGVIDLDKLFDTGVMGNGDKQEKRAGRIIDRINKILSVAVKNRVICVTAPGMRDEFMMDVDLSGIKKRSFFKITGLSKRFIAVNVYNSGIKELYETENSINMIPFFHLIKKLIENSGFFVADSDDVMKRVIEIIVLERSQ